MTQNARASEGCRLLKDVSCSQIISSNQWKPDAGLNAKRSGVLFQVDNEVFLPGLLQVLGGFQEIVQRDLRKMCRFPVRQQTMPSLIVP